MGTTTISLTEAKRSLGEVVNRVAYGGERIILESRGKPQVAVINLDDLRELEESGDAQRGARQAQRREALAKADELRARILARTGGIPLGDSVEELRQLREERLHEIAPDL